MSELSREQVEEYTNRFHNCGFLHLKKVFDGHDAALRATIEQRDGQIEKLAAFIVLIPGEPSKSEGAVDTAIRIITQQAQELDESERKLVGLCHAHGTALIEIHDLKKELAQAKGNYAIQKAAADDYEQQLAASQARCRELERDKEQAVYALGQLEEKYLQLQATLAAREAEP